MPTARIPLTFLLQTCEKNNDENIQTFIKLSGNTRWTKSNFAAFSYICDPVTSSFQFFSKKIKICTNKRFEDQTYRVTALYRHTQEGKVGSKRIRNYYSVNGHWISKQDYDDGLKKIKEANQGQTRILGQLSEVLKENNYRTQYYETLVSKRNDC